MISAQNTDPSSDEEQKIAPKLAFFTAVQFLTRLPVPGAMSGTMEQYQAALRASVVYFPVVGVFIGMFTALTYTTFGYFWSPLVAATLAIACEAVLTGAFHEDALADATDALGGGWTREQVLEILKDSRHGTYGVLALVLGVTLRIALTSNLGTAGAWLAIPFSAGMGRWSILILMSKLEPIADRHTMARDVGSRPTLRTILTGFLGPGVAIAFSLGGLAFFAAEASLLSQALLGFGLSIVLSMALTLYYTGLVRRRVGGVTGDFLGANCYLVQLVTLLGMQTIK